MAEFDAILMSLIIFVPTAFALVLMVPWIFPKGSDEYMRWWSPMARRGRLGLSIAYLWRPFWACAQAARAVPALRRARRDMRQGARNSS